MKTNKHHNEALLSKLQEVNDAIFITNKCIEKSEEGDPVKHFHEIELWTLETKLEAINKALINQELENW